MFERDRVGDIGEGRRSLVRGNHEIGIVAVVNDHGFRMRDLIVDEVVGDREQGADEHAIALGPLGQPRVAVGRGRQLLGIKAALRAGRHNHRILDHLRLHQAQNLGPEIVAPVRPADAAASDRPAAQMDAFDTRAEHPDLAPRHRCGKSGHQRRIELERQRLARGRGERVRAEDRLDQSAQAPQDPVVVDRADLGEGIVEPVAQPFDLGLALGPRGIVGCREQLDQRAGRSGSAAQRIDDRDEAERNTGLAKVAEPGAQPHHRPGIEPDIKHQLVELVVLGRSAQDIGDRPLDLGRALEHRIEVSAFADFHPEVVDVAKAPAAQGRRNLLEHLEAEILQHRDRFGQRDQATAAIGLEAQLPREIELGARDAHAAVGVVAQFAEAQDIGRRVFGRGARAVSVREGWQVSEGEAGRARRAGRGNQFGLDRRRPAADHFDHRGVERIGVGQRRLGVDILGVADQREIAVAKLDRPAGDFASDLIFEQHRDRGAPRSSQLLARQPDKAEQLALEDAADLEQRRARPVGKRHRHHYQRAHGFVIDGDQQVARQGRNRVAQRLAGMALGVEAEILVELLQPLAEHRHLLRREAQGFTGPQPGMHADARDLVLVAERDDDQVERDAAMDRRLALGLGHQRHFAALFEIAHRVEAAALVGRCARNAEDPQRLGGDLVGLFDMVAEQGHGAAGEPFEQRLAFRIGDRRRVLAHFRLELLPIAHRQADVGEHPPQVGR